MINTVKVKCPVCEGNELGYYVANEDEVPEGAELFDEQCCSDEEISDEATDTLNGVLDGLMSEEPEAITASPEVTKQPAKPAVKK